VLRGFKRAGEGRVVLRLDRDELEILDSLFADLAELVAPPAADPDADPLAAMVGIDAVAEVPDDPALARLFPDAYSDDDPQASMDFRRFTERSLREGKLAALRTARGTIARGGDKLTLTREEAQAWLAVLNDLRLTLGTRLEITEDSAEEFAALPDDDPRALAFHLYDMLTWLQDSLLRALGAP
jgi:hypothetical protein